MTFEKKRSDVEYLEVRIYLLRDYMACIYNARYQSVRFIAPNVLLLFWIFC